MYFKFYDYAVMGLRDGDGIFGREVFCVIDSPLARLASILLTFSRLF